MGLRGPVELRSSSRSMREAPVDTAHHKVGSDKRPCTCNNRRGNLKVRTDKHLPMRSPLGTRRLQDKLRASSEVEEQVSP